MKTMIVTLCVFLATIHSHKAFALRNPAAVYCTALGYEYRIIKTVQGERGYCVLPDGQMVDAWQFLQGKVAQQYNYCAINGYGQKRITDQKRCVRFLTDSCLVCIIEDGSEVEVTELMGLTLIETICGDGMCGHPENLKSCPEDCPSGSRDYYCDGETDEKCDPDCSAKEDPDCH
jgi:putative hemolysin